MFAHAGSISPGLPSIPRGKAPRRMRAADVAQAVARGLRRWVGATRNAAKEVGRLIGADHRAVENWMAGTNAPGAVHLVTLITVSPPVRAEVFALTGIDLPPALNERQVEAICRAAAILEGRG